MDFDSLRKQTSGLRTAAVIVMNKQVDPVNAILQLSKFYVRESCSQCTPCRDGTDLLIKILERINKGKSSYAEIDMLRGVTRHLVGHTIYDLGDAAVWPV
jgi:NADH-quinone oxidoreductase subunit F